MSLTDNFINKIVFIHCFFCRQKNIINIVKNCDKGNLTIDDVAEKPLTKRNVAIAFGDLLSLCKQKQVILITDENLCLQTIEKGSEIGEY